MVKKVAFAFWLLTLTLVGKFICPVAETDNPSVASELMSSGFQHRLKMINSLGILQDSSIGVLRHTVS